MGASGDGATEGTDYGTVADFTITLSAGSTSVTGTFSIDPTEDTLDEGDGGERYGIWNLHGAYDKLRDAHDNGQRRRAWGRDSFPEFDFGCGERGGYYGDCDGGASGDTARATRRPRRSLWLWAEARRPRGTDYGTVADFTITLSAGSTSVTGTFSIDPTEDTLDEGTGESVTVSGTSTGLTISSATLTITDNDDAPGDVTLSLSSTSVAESAEATTVTVTAALPENSTSYPAAKAITVAVGGGTATEGTDYGTVADFTITLSAGSTSVTGTFSIDPTEDTLDEGTGESVTVSGTSTGLTISSATLTITDNDDAPGGRDSFPEFDFGCGERGGYYGDCDGGASGEQHELPGGQGDHGGRGRRPRRPRGRTTVR